MEKTEGDLKGLYVRHNLYSSSIQAVYDMRKTERDLTLNPGCFTGDNEMQSSGTCSLGHNQ